MYTKLPFAAESGEMSVLLGSCDGWCRNPAGFRGNGGADPSVLTTDLFSYLELLGGFPSLTLRPLGSGERVLDVSLLKVVGIIPRFPQHLHPRLLVQAQGLDVLPDPRVGDFIPLLSLCVQPGAKEKERSGINLSLFFVTCSLATRLFPQMFHPLSPF